MNALELKYGCNPNQKPSRIFVKNGDLPIVRAILISWMPSTAGSW